VENVYIILQQIYSENIRLNCIRIAQVLSKTLREKQFFSQRCQWLSPVRQTTLTKFHFKTWELVLASAAACVKTPAYAQNLIIQWIEVG